LICPSGLPAVLLKTSAVFSSSALIVPSRLVSNAV
jgi:hypothetical protein